jgi:hypothetical protein
MPCTNVWQDDQEENFPRFFSARISSASTLAPFQRLQKRFHFLQSKKSAAFFSMFGMKSDSTEKPRVFVPFYLSGKMGELKLE